MSYVTFKVLKEPLYYVSRPEHHYDRSTPEVPCMADFWHHKATMLLLDDAEGIMPADSAGGRVEDGEFAWFTDTVPECFAIDGSCDGHETRCFRPEHKVKVPA